MERFKSGSEYQQASMFLESLRVAGENNQTTLITRLTQEFPEFDQETIKQLVKGFDNGFKK